MTIQSARKLLNSFNRKSINRKAEALYIKVVMNYNTKEMIKKNLAS